MARFLVGRSVELVATLLVALTFIFTVVSVLPGDPVRALFGVRRPPPQYYEAIVEEYHFDEPLPVQYVLYLRDLATGDLGRSFPRNPFGDPESGPPVSRIVAGAAPVSARIVAGALVIQAILGTAAGVLGALRAGTRTGTAVYAGALVLVSIPVLVVAYLIQAYAGLEAGWLPVVFTGGWSSYVGPTVALALLSTGYVALLARTELLDTLREPFIRAARARALGERRIVAVHALRPSLVPVTTFLAANVGQLLTGLIIVEAVFRVPGIGGQVFSAIQNRDRALLLGLVTVIAVGVVVANAIADVVHALIDPRVRLAVRSGRRAV